MPLISTSASRRESGQRSRGGVTGIFGSRGSYGQPMYASVQGYYPYGSSYSYGYGGLGYGAYAPFRNGYQMGYPQGYAAYQGYGAYQGYAPYQGYNSYQGYSSYQGYAAYQGYGMPYSYSPFSFGQYYPQRPYYPQVQSYPQGRSYADMGQNPYAQQLQMPKPPLQNQQAQADQIPSAGIPQEQVQQQQVLQTIQLESERQALRTGEYASEQQVVSAEEQEDIDKVLSPEEKKDIEQGESGQESRTLTIDWTAEETRRKTALVGKFLSRCLANPVVDAMIKMGIFTEERARTAATNVLENIVIMGLNIDKLYPTMGKTGSELEEAMAKRIEGRELSFSGMRTEDEAAEALVSSRVLIAKRLMGGQIVDMPTLTRRFMGRPIMDGSYEDMEKRLETLTKSDYFKQSYPTIMNDEDAVRDMGMKLLVRLNEKQSPLRQNLLSSVGNSVGAGLIVKAAEILGEYEICMLGDLILGKSDKLRRFVEITGLVMPV